jgi:Tfp pilus assembly protein PilZ
VTDKTTLRLEYKKFNTFLFDYLRSLSRGWIFMKMKHKYPIGADLSFVITSAGIDKPLTIPGTVIFHGLNDEGKDGVGIRLKLTGEAAANLRRVIGAPCRELFGERLAGRILALAENHDEARD